MAAYFPSKYTKRIHAAFAAAAVLICLLGTHWLGYAHGIAHSGLHSQNTEQCAAIDLPSGLVHGSDACHLYDALTLAGFAPPTSPDLLSLVTISPSIVHAPQTRIAGSIPSSYQSRAPPTYIL